MANAIVYIPFNFHSQNEGIPLSVNVIDANGTSEIYRRITQISKPCSIPDSPNVDDTGPAGSKQVEIVAYGPVNLAGVDIVIGIAPK
jgi:hypothetical protein